MKAQDDTNLICLHKVQDYFSHKRSPQKKWIKDEKIPKKNDSSQRSIDVQPVGLAQTTGLYISINVNQIGKFSLHCPTQVQVIQDVLDILGCLQYLLEACFLKALY